MDSANPMRAASYSKLNDGNQANSRTPFIAGRSSLARWKCIFVGLVIVCCIAAIGVGIGFGVSKMGRQRRPEAHLKSDTLLRTFESAAVVSQSTACTKVGSDILLKGGSAVDAAIATMVCEGAYSPQSVGLGGGFFMVVFRNDTGKMEVIDARETAPLRATFDMFEMDSVSRTFGGLSVAVPGELRGYWMAHQRYGKLNWSALFDPTVRLCREGIVVSEALAEILRHKTQKILSEPSMRYLFFNNETGEMYRTGERIVMTELAETLSIVAEKGAEELYNGELAQKLVADVKALGGIILPKDLEIYQPVIRESLAFNLSDSLTLHTVPPPGSGLFLGFILQVLDGLRLNISSVDREILTDHLFVEACKYGYAKRPELGDAQFSDMTNLTQFMTSPEMVKKVHEAIDEQKTYNPSHYGSIFAAKPDHGTAHVSVLAPNGDAVSMTSTLNLWFGAMVRSTSTGIILNNEMDDFSTPNIPNSYGILPSEANYILAGKRPASSMSPAIVLDSNGAVRYVLGSSGGIKIISTTAYTFMMHHWLDQDLGWSVAAPRLHHQLHPNVVEHDPSFPQDILDGLVQKGHRVQPVAWMSATNVIYREADGKIQAASDPRRHSYPAGF